MGNHRAERRGPRRAALDPTPAATTRGTRSTGSPGGKRKAARRSTSPVRILPSAPTAIGAVAIIAAAGGAITFGQGQLPGSNSIELSAGASSSLNGTDAFGFGNDPRSLAISRDSQRQAEQDAASADLKAAAEEQSAQRNAQLASLAASAERRADQIAKNLWVLPTIGYRLTARYGATGLWASSHTGLDFAGSTGSPIIAVANGVITETGYDGAYGYKTVHTLADGTEIWYCHQDSIGVEVGDSVVQGDQIGTLGSTGHVTGPHLHLEVRPGGGDPVDPYSELVYHGVTP
ncbi:MAG TPA: M23 family metallopeptidase [Marmoricola sp.]